MDSSISRRVALNELLEMPDPPELHRGNVVRLPGKPDRHEVLPKLAAAFAKAKLIEFRQRAILSH